MVHRASDRSATDQQQGRGLPRTRRPVRWIPPPALGLSRTAPDVATAAPKGRRSRRSSPCTAVALVLRRVRRSSVEVQVPPGRGDGALGAPPRDPPALPEVP